MIQRWSAMPLWRQCRIVSQLPCKHTSSRMIAAGRPRYLSSFRNDDDGSEYQAEKTTLASSPTSTNNDNKANAADSFVPVVNMPANEFAQQAFFALHRPLLSVNNDHERLYTSQQDMTDANDEALSNYLMDLRPFVPPDRQSDDRPEGTSISIDLHDDHVEILDYSMPMYHMPHGEDVLDYLTAMHEKLKRRNAQEDQEDNKTKRSRRTKYWPSMRHLGKRKSE